MLCLTAEGGTSGKNSSTDQRQLQATSQEGPVVGGDGSINTGSQLIGAGSTIQGSNLDISVTDQGAIDRAFDFGEVVIAEAGKVLTGTAAQNAATVAANSASLAGLADIVSQNSAGGATASQNKTLTYVVLGALALVAAIFIFRR